MKHLLIIAFLLLAATPAAFAQNSFAPSFKEQIAQCVTKSVAYARFATMAADAADEDHAAFIAYIQQIADKNTSPQAQAFLVHLGELAWSARGTSIGNKQNGAQAVALKMFNECYDKLGDKV